MPELQHTPPKKITLPATLREGVKHFLSVSYIAAAAIPKITARKPSSVCLL